MGEITYDRTELNRLLETAKSLGFRDDVAHWTAKLLELDAREAEEAVKSAG